MEVGGAGLFYSVNYERQISKTPGFSWRVGLGGYTDGDFYVTYNTGFAYLFALNEEESSFIDFGANFTVAREYIGFSAENKEANIFESVVPGVSFRKHFNNDIVLKAGINAIINGNGHGPWLNLGFGKRF
ncbi:MAG: hypothetical protein ACQETL_14550 [Bacteroidota bacterium]